MMGRSLLAYIPVNIANLIVSFGTVVILTRLLSAEEFGRYAIAVITMQIAHMLVFTWMEASAARFEARAEREGETASYLKTLYSLAAGVSLIAGIVFAAFLFFLPISDVMKTVLAFAIGSTCLQVFFNIGMEVHKAAHRIKRYSLSFSTQTLLSFTIGIILILATPLRESGPFIGIIIGVIIVLAFDLIFMLPRLKGGTFDPVKAKTYAQYGIPISLSLILAIALSSADIYLIAAFMGEASAGEYNAGYNLANRSVEMLFIWLSMAVTPMAITAFEKSGSQVSETIMRDYGASLLWITLPAATGIALVTKDAGFVLGESVRENAVLVMPWIAFAGVLNGFINYYIQRAFVLSGETKSFVWVLLAPFILNIGLNLWLIPAYGLMGAVFATIAAYSLGAVIAFVVARRYYPLPLPTKAIAKISFACLIMAVCVVSIPWPDGWPSALRLFVKAGWGICVYMIVCWLIDAANCRPILVSIFSKFKSTPPAEVVRD